MKKTRKLIFLVFIAIAIVGMFLPIATFNDNSAASVVLFGIIIIGSLLIRYLLNDRDPKPAKGGK